MPMFGILIVVLLIFAAFAVDLGAAWAERRQDQTAADAAAMAGALEYTNGTPTSANVVAKVVEFAALNLDIDAADWTTCQDDGAYALLDPGIECISLAQTDVAGVVLRVKIPERHVPTSFARIIGIDTISVSALAEAQVDYLAFGRVRPWSIPTNADGQECLGTPPDGQITDPEPLPEEPDPDPEDPSTDPNPLDPCNGSESGNFGFLDSPWFGAPSPPTPFGLDQRCPPSDFNARTSRNVALGLDHPVVEAPGVGVGDGHDDCDALADPTYVPWALHTATGFSPVPLQDGLIDPGTFGTGGTEALLRQDGGIPGSLGRLNLQSTGTDRLVDNVGLWEYLASGNGGQCSNHLFETGDRSATVQMDKCIRLGTPKFNETLLTSPRFAVVPRLDYIRCDDNASDPQCLQGAEWLDILGYVPVYLQGTWFTCKGPGAPTNDCLFQPDNYPGDYGDNVYSPVFYPGEGTATPVIPDAHGDYVTPGTLEIKGLSAFTLDWGMMNLPDDYVHIGDSFPFRVQLYR